MERSSSIDLEPLLAHSGWTRKLAIHLARDPDRADDLLQETWLRALEHPPETRSTSAGLRAWLATVMRNLASSRRRDADLRAWHESRAAKPEEWTEEEIEERVRLQRRLADAVLALGEPYRGAIVLRYFECLSTHEVARRQHVSDAAARQRISRGLAMLRAHLDREHDGDRGAWCAAIARVLGKESASIPLSPLLEGGLLVSAQVKLLGTIAVVLAITSLLVWRASRTDAPARSEEPLASAEPAAVGAEARSDARPSPPAERTPLDPVTTATASGSTIDRDRDLHGQVIDPSGRPVAEASVEVFRNESSEYISSNDLFLLFNKPAFIPFYAFT